MTVTSARRAATVRPWRGTALADMPRPIFIAHRVGGATGIGPEPENTSEGARELIAAGSKYINPDLHILADGLTFALMHDSTVDRTTTGSGTISAMSVATYRALTNDTAKSWGPGWPYPASKPPTFDDFVAEFGGRVILGGEMLSTGTASTLAATIVAAGIKDYCQFESTVIPDLATLRAAGISTALLLVDGETVATTQGRWPTTNGPVGINYYQASPAGGTIDAYIQALVTAGYAVQVFSIARKQDSLDAIASAAAAGGVLDAVISNDPVFHDTRVWQRRTTDSFASGRWAHGFVAGSGGSIPRAVFTGTTPNRVGYTSAIPTASVSTYFHIGEVSPLPATFTLNWTATLDGAGSVTTNYIGALVCATTDRNFAGTVNKPNGYFVRLNQSGAMSLYRSSGGNDTRTQIGSTVGSSPIVTGQSVPLRFTTTATQVTVTRVDTGDTITFADAVYRGGYLHLGKTGATPLSFTDAVLASGQPTVTSATAAFSATTDVGKLITGTGIATGTTILSVESTTSATMSANATASGNPVTIALSRPNIYVTFSSVSVT